MGLLNRLLTRIAGTVVVQRYAEAAWHAAGTGRRAIGWNPSTSHINALLAGDVPRLRTRSRSEVRQNPWAQNAIGEFVDSVVGNGISPTPNTVGETFREELEATWDTWINQCDADGLFDFYGLQALTVQSYREGGDCFVRFRPRLPIDGLEVPLQLQLLEAEQCDPSYSTNLPGREIRAGIEFDMRGKRTAYHLWKSHPGDPAQSAAGLQRVAVPAANVLHIFTPTRPGQIRGVPSLASVLAVIHDLGENTDAHTFGRKLRNMFVGFEETPIESQSILGAAEGVSDDGVPIATLEPGTVQKVGRGKKMTFSDPPSGADDEEAFNRLHLRGVAAGAGISYEGLTGDLANVSFSSIRSGTLRQYRRHQAHSRRVLGFQFNRPVYQRWFETGVISGAITVPAEERNRLHLLSRPTWVAQTGQAHVNPFQEVRAIDLALATGLTSRTIEVPRYAGVSAATLDRQRAADRKRELELEVPTKSSASIEDNTDPNAAGASSPGKGTNAESDIDDGAESEELEAIAG